MKRKMIMSWYHGVILLVIVYIVKSIFLERSLAKNRNYDELLRFFSPNGKFKASEIAEIIKERTSSRRDISDANLIMAFEQLYKEGKLCKEVNPHNIYGRDVNVIRYYLPQLL